MIDRFRRAGTLLLAVATLCAAGCTKGVGDSCDAHADCLPGLACLSGKCEPCTDAQGAVQACIPIDLVVKSCDQQKDPLQGASYLRITVSGDGMASSVDYEDVSTKSAALPGLPFGKNRRVEVEALAKKDDALPVSRGESDLFDVTADDPLPSVTVYLRRVLAFTATASRREPTVCAGLHQKRAGHTATTLKDGRVLIAGGYTYDASGNQSFLKSVEIYDPHDGTFRVLGNHLTVGRAFHTATLLPDGRVLIAGGTGLINDQPEPLKTAELFDPTNESFTYLVMIMPRSRHAAAALPNGLVLLSGGIFNTPPNDRYPTDRTEVFDPRAPIGQAFSEGPRMDVGTEVHSRADHAEIAVDDERILAIGGTDGNGALDSVDVFHYFNGAFTLETTASYHLAVGRADPLAALMSAGGTNAGVLVTGAPADKNTTDPNEAWDWLPVAEGGSDPGRNVSGGLPTARTGACAAPFDGGILVAGGKDISGKLLDSADAFTIDTKGQVQSNVAGTLGSARASPACAELHDGTVLVTGGEDSDGKSVTDAAEVYEPLP